MAQELTSIAIGNPAVGGFVIGGENVATSFTLEDWFPSVSRNQISISANFFIQADDVASFSTLIQASRELSSGSVSLGVTTRPSARTITVDLTVSSQTVTLTRTAGDSFASTDEALPINIDGVGSFMITEYVSSSVVRCLIAPSLTAPGAASGLSANIGTEFLRIDEIGKVGGFRSDVSIRENPDDDADETRKPYTLDATWERPGNDSRGSSFAHRREASYRILEDEAGLKYAEFSGTYTAGDGAGSSANYVLAVNAWVNTILGAVSSNQWTKVGKDFYSTDDENSLTRFVINRREINFDEFSGGADHPAISNAEVAFVFQKPHTHGLRGHETPGTLTMSYAAPIAVSEAKEAAIATLYNNTIRPYLLLKARAIYGDGVIIQLENGPNIDPVNNKVEATIVALVTSTGSNIVSYEKTISYDFDYNNNRKRKHDGGGHRYHRWSGGETLVSEVSVSVTKRGNITRSATGGIFLGIGGRGSGGALTVNIVRGGSASSGDGVQEQFTEYPTPSSTPGAILGFDQKSFPAGSWHPDKIKVVKSPRFNGLSPDPTTDLSVERYTQLFTWEAVGSVGVPQVPDSGSPGGQAGKGGEPPKNVGKSEVS